MNDSRVRIFVSSPADVDHERAIVKDVIERLAGEFLPYFVVEPVLWEDEALTADRTFQAGMVRPVDCDIVLVVLWTRLGSPLPQDPYQGMTGTEWEFLNAIEAVAESHRPEVLVYRKANPKLVDITNPQATREAIEDRERLEAFFQHHFFNEDRTFRRAFRTFDSDAAFRNLVEVQLRKLLNRRISVEKRGGGQGLAWRDSPFRPDGAYELGDERIFTGREAETRELLHRLQERMQSGRGLILVSGPSGCGKSSLVRAGLLPRLVRPYQIEGVAACRWCLVDPGAREDPLQALAEGLCAPAVLGEILARFGLQAAHLASTFARDPVTAVSQIRAALASIALMVQEDTGEAAVVRLVVVVDPLDAVSEAAGAAFGTALAALAGGGDAWVLALLRSDRLGLLPCLGPLAGALDRRGWMRLDPPVPARIRQIMEIPALAAGLEYEGPPGRGVVERLEAEAAGLTFWAPLLEGALDHLYRNRAQAPGRPATLTLAALQEGGAIPGDALARARRVWDEMDEAARGALPRLCRALVTLEKGVQARPAPRAGHLTALEADPACARLTAALIRARLLVAAGDSDAVLSATCPQPDYSLRAALGRLMRQSHAEWRIRLRRGRPPAEIPSTRERSNGAREPDSEIDWQACRRTVVLAHPVLIDAWPPVRGWLADPNNRRALTLRHQISRQAELWKRTDCNREYLLGEEGFAAAAAFGEAFASELEPEEAELLAQSEAWLRYQRRGNRLVRLTGALLGVLLLMATVAAVWAWNASRTATLNLHLSRLNAADLAIARGNTPAAVVLAQDAAPHLPRAALETLSRAFAANRLIAMVQPDPSAGGSLAPAFSPDGDWLATAAVGEGALLWRLEEGNYVRERALGGDGLGLHTLVFAGTTGDGHPRVLGIAPGGVWRLPAVPGAPPDWPCGGEAPTVTALAPSGLLAIAHAGRRDGFAVCLLDPDRPGEVRFDAPVHASAIRSLAFSPEGTQILTASRDGRTLLLDAETGGLVLALPREGPLPRPVNRAVFDAQGERIATAAADETVRVYRRDGTPLAELVRADSGGRSFKVHNTAVRDVAFSAEGRYLIAVDDEGQVVRWDLEREGQAVVLGHHDLSVEQVRLSPGAGRRDGAPLVLTASLDKSARLWDLDTGKPLAVLSHDAPVDGARFGAAGRRIMTFSAADGSARLWSLDPVSRLSYVLRHEDHVWHLALAPAPVELDPTGDLLLTATADFDGIARVWRYARGSKAGQPALLWSLAGHEDRIRRVAFSPDSRWLATAAYDGTARIWDVVTGSSACVLSVARAGPAAVYRALFAPDGSWVLTASNDAAVPVRLWDRAACAALPPGELADAGAPVQAAALVARGQEVLIATGDDAGRLRVLRKAPGQAPELLCELPLHEGAVADVALSEGGGWVASAGEDGRAAVVEITDGECGAPRNLLGHSGSLYSVEFSPGGGRLITASLDSTARVWSRDGRLLAILEGHRDRVYQAGFNPAGDYALTASRDGAVRVWKVPPAGPEGTLASYLVLDAELGGAAHAAFSPDGRYLAGAYWENAAVLWRLWAEDDDSPLALREAWGEERARLAIVREAHRFLQENRLGEGGGIPGP